MKSDDILSQKGLQYAGSFYLFSHFPCWRIAMKLKNIALALVAATATTATATTAAATTAAVATCRHLGHRRGRCLR